LAEDAVKKAPDNPGFRYHLGMALSGAGEKDRARTELQKALQLKLNGPMRKSAKNPSIIAVVGIDPSTAVLGLTSTRDGRPFFFCAKALLIASSEASAKWVC